MKNIIFKTFQTFKHPYLYDRHTNSIVILSKNEYKELKDVENGLLSYDESNVVKKYQNVGMLIPNVITTIEHSSTIPIESYINTRAKQLTLQVTQQCNLRCEYCTYSGIYNRNRTHSSKRMSWEVAKKSIDFFLKRNIAISEIVIGFYGGEPLLEFDLIKKCVKYAKQQVEGKTIVFNMTTNGTLLNDEIVDFLVEHDFKLSISLDGSKSEHDKNRKFLNGQGSFDIIINNIQRIKQRYPEYDQKLTIMTTVNPHIDIDCVLEFFNSSEIFTDKFIMFNSMKETSLDDELEYSNHYYQIRNLE